MISRIIRANATKHTRTFSSMHTFTAKDAKTGNILSYRVPDNKLSQTNAKELSRILSSMGWNCSTKEVDEEQEENVSYTIQSKQCLTIAEEEQLGKLLAKCGNNVHITNIQTSGNGMCSSQTIRINTYNGSKITMNNDNDDKGSYSESWSYNADIMFTAQQIFAAFVAIGTVLYINEREKPNEKTNLIGLLVPTCCGFFAPLMTVVICGAYVGYSAWFRPSTSLKDNKEKE